MYSIIQPDRTIIKAEGERNNGHTVTVFLAGTIEMGAGVRWHAKAAERIYRALQGKAGGALMMPELAFYNPRRDDGFAPGMEERQIRWEQERLREADYVFMYLQADTKSPVSLLEFGQFIASPQGDCMWPATPASTGGGILRSPPDSTMPPTMLWTVRTSASRRSLMRCWPDRGNRNRDPKRRHVLWRQTRKRMRLQAWTRTGMMIRLP